jgi:hypothetical protein
MTPPDESLTVPEIDAVDWAEAGVLRQSNASTSDNDTHKPLLIKAPPP